MTLSFNFIGGGLGTCGALVVCPISNLHGGSIKPFLHFVQSPFWVFTLGECLPEVILLFAEKHSIATHCLGPLVEGVNNTKFGLEVVTVLL